MIYPGKEQLAHGTRTTGQQTKTTLNSTQRDTNAILVVSVCPEHSCEAAQQIDVSMHDSAQSKLKSGKT